MIAVEQKYFDKIEEFKPWIQVGTGEKSIYFISKDRLYNDKFVKAWFYHYNIGEINDLGLISTKYYVKFDCDNKLSGLEFIGIYDENKKMLDEFSYDNVKMEPIPPDIAMYSAMNEVCKKNSPK